ncbi:MAG: hypothetical protein M3O70_09350 [Actinomycetota bacterium]|nr:hypothetical protein [Actinomycetota bacterium]
MALAEHAPGEPHLFGWYLGFAIAIVVIAAVVALVAPILVLAARIGRQAPLINEPLQRSYQNTAALTELRETIDHAEVIVEGLKRGRSALEGSSNAS